MLVNTAAILRPGALDTLSLAEWNSVLAVNLTGSDAGMLPHAEDLLTLARFAWERGESIPADDAQPVYLRDKVATPKAR